MVELLYVLTLVFGIVASLSTIMFTYYQYRKSKDQEKGPSDAATSDRPGNECNKNT